MTRKNRFFEKRNGADALSLSLIVFAFFLLIVFLICPAHYLTLIALIPTGFAIWRILSTRKDKREKENEAFVSFFTKLGGRFRLTRDRIRDRHTHIYFRCGCCERYLRVARGNGVVEVTCPNCHTVSRLDTGDKPEKEEEKRDEAEESRE